MKGFVYEPGRSCRKCLTFLEALNERFYPALLWSGCRAPSASRIMNGLHASSQQSGIDEVNFWQTYVELGTSLLISPLYDLYLGRSVSPL